MNKKAFIPISALMGALLLALVATMTPFVAEPDLAYAQSQSTDTTLYELSIDGQGGDSPTVSAFMPPFVPGGAPAEDGYTVYVPTGTGSVDLTATASHTRATVAVKAGASKATATDVADISDLSLQPAGEDTVILVTVTAADNISMVTYNVTVMRGAADSDVTTLSALSLAEVEIEPNDDPFVPGTIAYTARVPNSTTMVEVMATPTDMRNGATYAVTSTNADDEDNTVQNNRVVSLSEGVNTITVTVTAADRVTTSGANSYTVEVTRVPSSFSTDTTLSKLSLTDGSDAVSLSPSFAAGRAPASGGYTARVAHDDNSVVLTAEQSIREASVEVKVGATEAAAKLVTAETGVSPYTITPLQAEGTDTVILVMVTAEDEVSTDTYKVTVERAADSTSTETMLSALSVIAGGNELDLTPEFVTGTTSYAASVPYAIRRATVMATPTNRDATHKVTSNKDSSVQNNRVVDLSEGANVITVTVTAADGTTTNAEGTYEVTVTRAMSSDARVTTLAALSINDPADTDSSDGTDKLSLMPEFAPDRAPASGGYTAYVANDVDQVTLTAETSHTRAEVAVRAGEDEDTAKDADAIDPESGTDDYIVDASKGFQGVGEGTVILITVTAHDGFAKDTYKVTVMRGADGSDEVGLSALSLTAGGNDVGIMPAFASETGVYTASVPYATTMVEVMATATDADNGATHKVSSNKDSSVQNNRVVDLSVGDNVIKVTVTGADKVSTSEYMVTVTRVSSNLSTDTTLSDLSLADSTGDVDLEPEFVRNSMPAEGGYAAEVDDGIGSAIVTAVTAHTGATIEVRAGSDEADAMEDDAIVTPNGNGDEYTATLQGQGEDTVILVTVTAADLATTGIYKITVSRDAEDTNNKLKSLMLDGEAVTLIAEPADDVHARKIVDVPSVTVMATPRNSMAMVEVTSDNDADVEDNVVDLAVGINVISVKVKPVTRNADGTDDKTYTIRVRRDLSDDAELSSLSLKHLPMDKMAGMPIDLTPMFASGVMTYNADAGATEKITVTAKAHPAADVSVTVNGTAAMMTDIPTYWDMLGCPAMNDSVRGYDDHNHPNSPDSPYCTTYHMDATHPGLMGDAKAVVDMTFADYYDVPLTMGNNTISVMVTAEDGMATEAYNVTVSVEAADDRARLLARYNTNGIEGIQLSEVNDAIDDFFDPNVDLSLEEVNIVIDLFFASMM